LREAGAVYAAALRVLDELPVGSHGLSTPGSKPTEPQEWVRREWFPATQESAARSAPCGDHDLDEPSRARRRWA